MGDHLGWYRKAGLPHFDAGGVFQFITYRLADSLSQTQWEAIERQWSLSNSKKHQRERRKLAEHSLDRGYGSCWLELNACAQHVWDVWSEDDGVYYNMLSWVIMPNHVHVLIKQKSNGVLPQILRRWKSRSAQRILRDLRKSGKEVVAPFWSHLNWDRFIRDAQHLEQVIAYIHRNPVKAGLVSEPSRWKWSSAFDGPKRD